MNHAPVGFDRRIRLEWLDSVAAAVADGLPPDAIRRRLDDALAGRVSGVSVHSARGKTETVLMHIWSSVPPPLVALRDDGLLLLQDAAPTERLAVHWGMCLATYPFFYSVAENAGRLLQLQGSVALADLAKRMREDWGERSTVERATQRVVRSFVDWGVLDPADTKGVFGARVDEKRPLTDRYAAWLLAATLSGSGSTSGSLRRLQSSPVLFPFEVAASGSCRWPPYVQLVHEGVDRATLVRPT